MYKRQNKFYPFRIKTFDDSILSIENSASIQNRWKYTNGYSSIWVRHEEALIPGCIDDIVTFKCRLQKESLQDDLKRYWNWKERQDDSSNLLRGEVSLKVELGPTWCVENEQTANDSFLNILHQYNSIVDKILSTDELKMKEVLKELTLGTDVSTTNDSKNKTSGVDHNVRNLKLVSGDICEFLRTVESDVVPEYTTMAVFLSLIHI